jgi:serine/threonine protein kinase
MDHVVLVKKKMFMFVDKKKKEERDSNLAVRLKVAFDISAALKFLHSKSIIYRDLKPENLGFDVRGDIKLFDLGLVKELHPHNRDRHGNWKLSMAGTPRYMAPECGMYQPYNLSADVYSFSMLLWEILALEKPLKDFTYTRLKNEIFIDGERPPIKKIFNKTLRSLIHSGWSQTPRYRPSMDAVYETLKKEYLRLVPTGSVSEEDISHNRRRSTFVARNVNRLSVRHLMRLNTVESDAGNAVGNASMSTPNLGTSPDQRQTVG